MRSYLRPAVVTIAAAACVASPTARAFAQPADDIAVLRAELRQLRAEVDALKRLVATQAAPQPQAAGQDPAVAMLQEQVAEQAQTKVESRSRMPVTLSGTIVSNTVFNSGEANWLENPNIVAPQSGPTGSFVSTLRQSQLALSVNGPDVGGWQTTGVVQVDFLGGAPGFQTGTVMGLPRLLYAFARLERERTAVVVGQDNMVLAPRDPTSLAAPGFPLLFRSGNLYLRAPQIRIEQRLGDGFDVRAGIVTPLAGDFSGTYVFAPAAGAGERSKAPAVQARLGHRREADAGARWDLGVSGHVGRARRVGGASAPPTSRQTTATTREWAAAVDASVDVGRVGFGGEAYSGASVGAFGGALGQSVRSAGGFAEVRLRATDRVSFNGGGGIDRVDDGDRSIAALRMNGTWFGNAIITLTPEVRTSLEYRHLETEAASGARRRNHHINFAFVYGF